MHMHIKYMWFEKVAEEWCLVVEGKTDDGNASKLFVLVPPEMIADLTPTPAGVA